MRIMIAGAGPAMENPMRRLSSLMLPALLLAAPALAHPKIVSSTPAADATVAPTNRIEIRFSEKLVAPTASLDMTDMPGMTMATPMKMKVATSLGTDGATLIATTVKPLPKGTYRISYQVAGADAHRAEGAFSFVVE